MTPETRERNRLRAQAWRAANADRHREHSRKYYEKNREKVRETLRKYRDDNRAKIAEQKRADYAANKDAYSERAKKWRANNRPKLLEFEKARRQERVPYRLWHGARARAKKAGIPFEITLESVVIPEFCPVLGIKLKCAEGRVQPNSPTLDRFIPALGYVPGNVFIISAKANTIKSDSSVEELRAVLAWVEATLRARTRYTITDDGGMRGAA